MDFLYRQTLMKLIDFLSRNASWQRKDIKTLGKHLVNERR